MTLKWKITIIVSLIFAVFLGVFYLAFRASILAQIEKVELVDNKKELSFAVRSINKEIKNLNRFLADWSEWDDTYEFVQGINKAEYIKNNLNVEAIVKQKPDLWIFLDSAGKLFHGLEVDHVQKHLHPLPASVNDFILNNKIPKRSSGFVQIDGRTYLMVSNSIMDSLMKKAPKGTMVLGIQWDASMIESEFPDEVQYSSRFLSKEEIKGYDPRTSEPTGLKELSQGSIISSAVMYDIYGQPAFAIEAKTSRLTNIYARNKLFYLSMYLLAAYASFIAIIALLTNKIIRLQEKMFQAGKLASLGTLGAGIAHELNNPLSVISGFARNLQYLLNEKGRQNDPEVDESIKKILASSERMKKVVDNIRVFSRPSVDSRSLKMESVNEVINSSLMLLGKQLETHNIKLDLSLAQDLPSTLMDPVKFQTAIQNLIINSREELDECKENSSKRIGIKTSTDGEKIYITVEDNGRGIPKESINKVFDLFYTTKDPGKGTGLGLPMVHGIVRDLNGGIEVESDREGTRFLIWLPIITRDRND